MIDREHELSVTRQAQMLNLSRSSVYYLPRPASPGDLALMRRITSSAPSPKSPFVAVRSTRVKPDPITGQLEPHCFVEDLRGSALRRSA